MRLEGMAGLVRSWLRSERRGDGRGSGRFDPGALAPAAFAERPSGSLCSR